MIELKPCPFCGKEIYYEFYSKRCEEFNGGCRNPDCIIFGRDFMFDDAKKWNSRPIEAQLQAENEVLRKAITEMIKETSNLISFIKAGNNKKAYIQMIVVEVLIDEHKELRHRLIPDEEEE